MQASGDGDEQLHGQDAAAGVTDGQQLGDGAAPVPPVCHHDCVWMRSSAAFAMNCLHVLGSLVITA